MNNEALSYFIVKVNAYPYQLSPYLMYQKYMTSTMGLDGENTGKAHLLDPKRKGCGISSCSGKGKCENNKCICDEGFAGYYCHTTAAEQKGLEEAKTEAIKSLAKLTKPD